MRPEAIIVLGLPDCAVCGGEIDDDAADNPHGPGYVHVGCHCFGCVRCEPGEPDAGDARDAADLKRSDAA